jgi:hypothetical protein
VNSAAPALTTRRAATARAAQSVDTAARTAVVIAATAAPVRRFGATEILDLAGADLTRLNSGRAPVLDSHFQSLDAVLGTVIEARIVEGALVATIRFAETDAGERAMQRAAAGELVNVSVGFFVDEAEQEIDAATGQRTVRVRKWTPAEISIVAVPADAAAHVRSTSEGGLVHMEPETQIAAPEARAAVETQIRELATRARRINPDLPADLAENLVALGGTVDQARAAIFAELDRRQSPEIVNANAATRTHENPEFFRACVADALMARRNPTYSVPPPARAFVGLTIPEIAREVLRRNSIPILGVGAAAVVTRALHTTSDFPLLLGEFANKTLRRAYEAAPSGIKLVARQTTAPNFRDVHKLAAGEFPTLLKVNEHGEFKSGTIGEEGGAIYRLATYGRIFGITRQALVNDDLNAFDDMSRRIAFAVAEFEASQLATLLTSNPEWVDGELVFSAAHANIAGSADDLDADGLTAGRKAMRAQKGVDGAVFINAAPRFLVVGPDLETDGEKLIAEISAATADDVNPFAGKLTLVVDPRIAGARWYLAADPNAVEGIEYAYLQEQPGPRTESRAGFEIDGVQVKVALDFGAGWADYRGWWFNNGS